MRVSRLLAPFVVLSVGLGGAVLGEGCAERAGARRLAPPGQLVDIGGRRMHLVCRGTGSPTVLLEASGPSNARQYEEILPALSLETQTCAYDRAGMGFSEPADDRRSAQDMVNDLGAVLDSASVRGPYVIVAGSFGGIVAELFARERPGDVAGLVTLDALTTETAGEPVVAGFATKACLARWAGEIGLLRLVDPFRLAKRDPIAFQLTCRASTWRAICQSLRDLPESSAQLRAAPPLRNGLPLTVVVHGEPRDLIPMASEEEKRAADPAWLAAERTFAARSSRSRWVVAAGSGHLIADEKPDLVIAEVRTMLAEVRRDGSRLDRGIPP